MSTIPLTAPRSMFESVLRWAPLLIVWGLANALPGVARGQRPGKPAPLRAVFGPVERAGAKPDRADRLAPATAPGLDIDAKVVRVLVGPAAPLAFEERDLGIDAAALRHQAAGQEHEQADVGYHEAGLVPLPGEADQIGRAHV